MSSQTVLNLVAVLDLGLPLGALICRQLRARLLPGNQRVMLVLVVLGLAETVQYARKLHAESTAIGPSPAACCWPRCSAPRGA